MIGRREIDRKAGAVLRAYRTWLSPKTADKRKADYDRRVAVQRANIKAKEERRAQR